MKSINLRVLFRDFRIGITNIFQYFKLIWNDRDWDYGYTYDILIFKLKRVSKRLQKIKPYIGYERDVEIINTIIRLLEKDLNEFYGMEICNYYESKNWVESIKNNEKLYELKNEIISNTFPEYYLKHIATYRRISKSESFDDQFKLARKISLDRELKCHYLAFELIKRNIQKWWD